MRQTRLSIPPLASLALALAITLGASAAEPLKVYFIGNSLTMSTTLDRVHGLFSQRGGDLQFGSQLSGGKSLIGHLNYVQAPTQKWICWETSRPSGGTFLPHENFYNENPENWRFGRYDHALVEHKWDALVMQPFASPLADDLAAGNAFIKLALTHQTAEQFYIYATWPRRPRVPGTDGKSPKSGVAKDIDFSAAWSATYTASPTETGAKAAANCATRDYFHQLVAGLTAQNPGLKRPIRLIPVGEVLFALDRKIKADALPGLRELAARKPEMLPGLGQGGTYDAARGVNLLYADAVHFNPIPHQAGTVGIFVSGSTLYTVLSGQNPLGLSAASYGFDEKADAALIKAIQETIWAVTSELPMALPSK